MIAVRGLRWSPGRTVVFDGLNLDLHPGRFTAIVGRSGCGKSSLLRFVAGVRTPDAGTVTGVPPARGFVFQDPALLPWRTLWENACLPAQLGAAASDPVAVAGVLARVGLAEHAHKLPAALSGGQRMRASLARALLSRPEVLFMDEALAALDGATRRDVVDVVTGLGPGLTVLLVTHDLADAARLADRVLVVDGPPFHVLADVAVTAPRPRRPGDVAEVVRQIEASS